MEEEESRPATAKPTCCSHRLDNVGFVSDESPKSGVEMQEMEKGSIPRSEDGNALKGNGKGTGIVEACRADLCQKHHNYHTDKERLGGNGVIAPDGSTTPADGIKMVFLLATLSLFAIWIIIYMLLSKMEFF